MRVFKSLLAKEGLKVDKNEVVAEGAKLQDGVDKETAAGEGDTNDGEGRPVDREEDTEFIDFIISGNETSALKDNKNLHMNWLRLILLPLTSAKILQEYFRRHTPTQVSLKFISIKSLGTMMPAWKPFLRTRLNQRWGRASTSSFISELSRLTTPRPDVAPDKFEALFQDGHGLSVEDDFRGKLHCEACLASLVHLSINSPELLGTEIQDLFDVGFFFLFPPRLPLFFVFF